MNSVFGLIIRKVETLVSTITIRYNIKKDDLAFPQKIYESIFIDVDKLILNTNRNVIIGKIYNPPSSKLKYFNNLEKNIKQN